MYPYPPTFDLGEPLDLWWGYARSTGEDICEISPRAWILRVREALGISSTPAWDQAFAEALVNAAAVLDREMPGTGWQDVLATLRADLAARRPSRAGFEFATWFAFYRPNRLRFDALAIPPTVILPTWGTTIPSRPSTRDPLEGQRLACFRVGVEEATWSINTAARRVAEAQSTLGIRDRAGESREQGTDVIEVGEGGVPIVALAIGGALTLAAVLLFSSTASMSSGPTKRRSR